MGMICVNQNEEINATTTPRCVASWEHTEEQVLHAVYLLGALVVVSAAWTVTSRRQRKSLKKSELGFSLNCRRWARTSRAAAIINRPVQLVVSFAILGFVMARLNSYDVKEWTYYTVLGLYAIAIVDDVVRFLASRYKLLYCFSPFTLLELLCLASTVGVGFGSVIEIDGVPTRTYLDFSVMRPVFIFRSYMEMEKHVPKSTKGWMMVRLGIKILLLIMIGASIMFFLETLGEMPFFTDNGFAHLYSCDNGSIAKIESSECSSETWSIMFSFYFTIVTLGTVGYGDNAPQTVLSRLLAILFIIMGIILFSMEIENLINLYKLRQIGNPPYTPKPESKHVLIMGNPSFAQLSAILRELFHADHVSESNAHELEAVVLGDRKSKFTNQLVSKLKADPIFAMRVTYVAGDPTRPEDLERSLARKAEAVFVFPDKQTDDPMDEDANNVMRVLATKRCCGPSVRFLVLVLRAETARHMLAAGVDSDDVICENVIKMGTLAQNAVSNGISTMLSNLSSSLSVDVGEDDTEGHASPLESKGKQHSDIQASTFNGKGLPLAWTKEYYEGAAKEMYLIHLSKKYAGLSFSKTSSKIFQDTSGSVMLIGVEVVFSDDAVDSFDDAESRVLLNPGESLIMTEWIQCYVIADDLDQVFNYGICPEGVSREEVLRPGSTPTIMDPVGNVFRPSQSVADSELACDELQSLTAFRSLKTPNYESIKSRDSLYTSTKIGSLVVDRSLESIALSFKKSRHTITGGNPYENPLFGAEFHGSGQPPNSFASGASGSLSAPPLEVLLHPNHIVVCSFLGEESLKSLQWLMLPLRGPYAKSHPPITILDAADPSSGLTRALSSFKDVYYVRGSPLVYMDLQRAGAKAAAAVIVLGKRSKHALFSAVVSDPELEASIADAEAIFATMLVELKMNFSKIFTVTELSNEVNSKFMGMSFQLQQLQTAMSSPRVPVSKGLVRDVMGMEVMKLWDCMLQHDAPPQLSEKDIFGLPLYMSGRLLHPELCENMLVQTYFNPSIHKIVRQLVGGPRCTGVIHTFTVPPELPEGCTYGDVFQKFASSSYAGICLGIYRMSTQVMGSSDSNQVELPIVITTPKAGLKMRSADQLFVLIGVHTLERAALRIQNLYRQHKGIAGASKEDKNKFFV